VIAILEALPAIIALGPIGSFLLPDQPRSGQANKSLEPTTAELPDQPRSGQANKSLEPTTGEPTTGGALQELTEFDQSTSPVGMCHVDTLLDSAADSAPVALK
jgi:hypothetical protein